MAAKNSKAVNTVVKTRNTFLTIAKIIAIIALVVIVAGLAVILNAKPQTFGTLPQFQKTNAPLPSSYARLLNANASTAAAIFSAAASNLSQSGAAFDYSGQLYVRPSGSLGLVATITSPLDARYYIIGNERRVYATLSGIPLLGTAQLDYIELPNTTLACTNFNSNAALHANISGAISGSHTLNCSQISEVSGLQIAPLVRFNLSQLASHGISVYYDSVYQSVYNGTPCTYAGGTMTQQGQESGSGAFAECISDTYAIPLSYSAYFSDSKGNFSISLGGTQISNSTPPATPG